MLAKFDNQRWPAMTIELAILGITTGLILKDIVNGYILMSFVVILCTFALQTTNVRFLWLYPVWILKDNQNQIRASEQTERLDTYFLKFYLLFSSIFLAVGVYHWFISEVSKKISTDHFKWLGYTLTFWESVLLEAILYLLVIFGLVIPLVFFFYGNKKIHKKLNQDQKIWLKELEDLKE